MSATQEDHTMNNDTLYFNCLEHFTAGIREVAVSIVISVVAILGLLGNGAVIWLLGFRMKKNPFSTYILNLALADFGVLISSVCIVVFSIVSIDPSLRLLSGYLTEVSLGLFHFAYSTSQILLTTISVDRCASVLFPFCHRFCCPERFSFVLCTLIWFLSILAHGLCCILFFALDMKYSPYHPLFYVYLVNAVVCLPLITVSTLILFVRFCFKSQQRHRGKLLRVIFLTLIFFLIFAFPLNVINVIMFNSNTSHENFSNVVCYGVSDYGWLCAVLNSFVNPLLYFLVGTKKRGLCGVLKLVLQRVFIEEEEARRKERVIQ